MRRSVPCRFQGALSALDNRGHIQVFLVTLLPLNFSLTSVE